MLPDATGSRALCLSMNPAYRPMLAMLVGEPFNDKKWVFESKTTARRADDARQHAPAWSAAAARHLPHRCVPTSCLIDVSKYPDDTEVPWFASKIVCPTADDAAKIKAPVLAKYGELDTRITSGWPGFDAALTAAHVPHEGYVYKGANHGFHNDTTPRYDEAAAKLAWQRTTATIGKRCRNRDPPRPERGALGSQAKARVKYVTALRPSPQRIRFFS
jgi:hypothetical protein